MSTAKKYVERTPAERRRAAIAKIHIACKTLGIEGEEYRAFLMGITGLQSTAQMSDEQRSTVLDKLARRGFVSPRTLAGEGGPGGPQQRLAKAIWHDLGEMGVLEDPSEAGLRKVARRLTGVEAIEWMDVYQMNALIEALKAWRTRERLKRASSP